MTESMSLGEQILRWRAEHDCSQRKLAELTGLAPQTIYAIENDLQSPSKTTIIKLRNVLERYGNKLEGIQP